jgi:hypothetical protein
VSAPADPRLGTQLAGYRIQAPLGRGGMGVVYLAEQLGPHRQVALKLLSAPVATGEAFRERFLRESELAAAIDHPNVLPVYDAGETDGVLWIAMRYVDGIDLAALLAREGPLAPEQALAVCGPVAGALDAAPDADAVWVAARTASGGVLARIDPTSNQVDRRPITLPHAPTGLAVTPDAGTVWLTTGGDQTLRRSTPRPPAWSTRSSWTTCPTRWPSATAPSG